MPMRGELSILAIRSNARELTAETLWSAFETIVTSRELIAILGFCATGLLVTAYFIHRFPDFGAMAEIIDLF
jgi:hypothetical protein